MSTVPNLNAPTPLTDWPLARRQRIRGVLTDIDDTLTQAGVIMPQALDALQRLRAAGIPVIEIGRAHV